MWYIYNVINIYVSCVPSSEYMFFRLLVVLRSVCVSLKTRWSSVRGEWGGGERREQPQCGTSQSIPQSRDSWVQTMKCVYMILTQDKGLGTQSSFPAISRGKVPC